MKLGFGSFMPGFQNQKHFFTDLISLDKTQFFFLIELPSVRIHILYLTIPTLMIPCKVADQNTCSPFHREGGKEASDSDWRLPKDILL